MMLLTVVAIVVILALLAFVGRLRLSRYYSENECLFVVVRDYQQDLVSYAASGKVGVNAPRA